MYHPMAPISARTTRIRCLSTQRSHRVDSPSCVSIRTFESGLQPIRTAHFPLHKVSYAPHDRCISSNNLQAPAPLSLSRRQHRRMTSPASSLTIVSLSYFQINL
ncbi:hypothetical protein K443DRAFT_349722 [Laccaria amethystina LaAM-08-1]|uniref:Uncharacterized protein n=1 Tax=Laccaria amethystina LaAM-08-1 TaxID=1095629 RepID=A0A0C9XF32_9AGAR|nr:hypothetical protein K443DRAFT_349722 [Laccaria amethystina LaAM-08-1]